jgi:hypothetical protein
MQFPTTIAKLLADITDLSSYVPKPTSSLMWGVEQFCDIKSEIIYSQEYLTMITTLTTNKEHTTTFHPKQELDSIWLSTKEKQQYTLNTPTTSSKVPGIPPQIFPPKEKTFLVFFSSTHFSLILTLGESLHPTVLHSID